MITINNYSKESKNIDWSKLPDALQNGHSNFDIMVKHYDSNDKIKSVIDTYIKKLNIEVSKQAKPKNSEHKDNWAGEKVAIKKSGKKFIVWSIKVDQIFANEKFSNHQAAVDFIEQNKMVLVEAKPVPRKTKKAPGTAAAKKKTENTKAQNIKSIQAAVSVEKLSIEVAFIKRYALLDGKIKSKYQILLFINALQKAILDKRIRKTSPYNKDIEHIQDELIRMFEIMNEEVKIQITPTKLVHYKKIANSQKNMLSVSYLKRFISLHGKTGVEDKAKVLKDSMLKAVTSKKITVTDVYKTQLEAAYKSLIEYTKGITDKIIISPYSLNGISKYKPLFASKSQKKKSNKTLSGLDENEMQTIIYSADTPDEIDTSVDDDSKREIGKNNVRINGVISSNDLSKMHFNHIGVKGMWLDVLGDISDPFFAMISGKPGSGKSTFLALMSKYFASEINSKVLYVSHEEGYSRTLQDKFERCNAFDDNTDITQSLPKNISGYDLVIIDSVSTLKLDTDDVQRLIEACRKTKTSLALVYHATKDGQYKGMSENEHLVDMTIMIEQGVTHVGKNRFGGKGQMNVFDYAE